MKHGSELSAIICCRMGTNIVPYVARIGNAFVLLIGSFAFPVYAEVTYLGDQGVAANILNNNPVQACIACHHSSLTGAARQSAPVGSNYDDYAASTAPTNVYTPSTMDVKGAEFVDSGYMPFSNTDLSQGLQDLMNQWVADGSPEHAEPDVTTSTAISIGKYSATLRGAVKENGENATAGFQYDTDSNLNSGASLSATTGVGGNGGGGEEAPSSFQRTVLGLSCGTQYWFRARTTGTSYSPTVDTSPPSTFPTDPCPVITNAPSNETITEGVLKTHDVDSNDGSVTYSLQGAPSGMGINSSTGLISWTPEEVLTSGTVTVRISDGTTEDTATFEWTVNSINDPPVISSNAPTVALETIEYQYDVVVDDPDDTVGELSFSLSGQPAGMTIDALGQIRWTPGIGQADVGPITVTVADGGEDKADPASEVFSISVNAPDGDGDGLADYDDNCPSTANADQEDTDGDDIGDACDPDEEGDGTFDSAIEFTVTQDGQNGVFLAQDAGTVMIDAVLSPEIVGVDPTWDWSGTDSSIRGLFSYTQTDTAATSSDGGESQISFDPVLLPVGQHDVDLVVTSGSVSTHTSITLDVRSGPSAPADADDDGVPVTQDGAGDSTNSVINGTGDGEMSEQVEVDGSARLRVGAIALAAASGRTPVDASGALLTGSEIEILIGNLDQLDGRTNTGGWFDFEVRGLEPGATAKVVLPLQSRLRRNAVYMKYRSDTGWQEFSTAGANSVASAARTGGLCPGPNDAGWTGGLTAFDECIRLTVVDGGPNDADDEMNGVILDPGGAVASGDDSGDSDPVDGGGGAFGPRTLLGLLLGGIALLVIAGWRRQDETA